MTHDSPSSGVSITRRRALAASGTAMLASMAGCSTILDAIGDQVLGAVNVFNQLDRAVGGSVTVVGPAGDTVLDETFDVPSNGSDQGSNIAAFEDVWTDAGEYEVSADLADVAIDGTSRAGRTVSIENTEEDLVGIFLGADGEGGPIAIRVGESFSDFARTDQSG